VLPRTYDNQLCSIARTLEVVGDRWTLLVIRDAFLGVHRFEDFQKSLGVARNVLTDRLNRLVEAGILRRRLYQERPERHEYRLTAKGLDLYPVLLALMQWGDRYKVDEPPVTLVHKACGEAARPRMACGSCAEPIGYFDLRAEYAPGAW
jgi:DNA-binding HxlR family transcriptional regulator